MNIMLILCKQSELDALLDKLDDWKEEGANVFLYGFTTKQDQGFLFLEWGKPIPELFHQKLQQDTDIIDYFTFSNIITRPRKDTPPQRKERLNE